MSFLLKEIECFGRFRKIAKSDFELRHVRLPLCPSVRPHGTTRFPLNGFLWYLLFEYSWKICRVNVSFIKI